MSEPISESNTTTTPEHSDVDSDVMTDWALVGKDGELQDCGDDSSSISGSSIEVMSLEDEETDLDLGESSSRMTSLVAEARTPMFILRVPSNEAALEALATESDESDESDRIDDSSPVPCPQYETGGHSEKDGPDIILEEDTSSGNSDHISDGETTRGETTPGTFEVAADCIQTDSISVSIDYVRPNNIGETCTLEEEEPSGTSETDAGLHEEITKTPLASATLIHQPNQEVCGSSDVKLVPSEDFNVLSGQQVSNNLNFNSEESQSNEAAEQDNDNIINEILEEDVLDCVAGGVPAKEDSEDDEPVEEGQNEDILVRQDPVRENDIEPIVIIGQGFQHGDQRYYYHDIQQDDPETESSTEMDIHDDRIESDQSELQTTDNSNLSNVDISDLMENIRVNRQYLHHPKPWIDVFLNSAIVLVVSVAIGMGIGHNLGSAPSWKIASQRTIQCHRTVDDYIHYTILDQKLDRCERKLVSREETFTKRYNKIFQENQKLKDEANLLKNEVYDLRSEVIRLKYKKSQDLVLQDSSQKSSVPHSNRESVTAVLVRANQLEQENSDLRLEIGRLKYGHHGNQKAQNVQHQEELSDVHEKKTKQNDRRTTDNLVSKVTSLKNELDIERERSEMWKNLYQVKMEELKSNQQKANNTTKDVFGCMKLMLKNLSLPVNISQKIEENWRTLQNASLGGFMDILKSFVHSEKQDKGQTWSSGTKKSQTGWSDTVNDVLNKTKASMSDVTQQIQDTWKQVKNLSHDLWIKHESSVSKHLKKVRESMDQATQHLKDSIHKSKWFNKKRKGKSHHGNRQNQGHFDRRDESLKKTSSFKASTKRRGHSSKNQNPGNQKHQGKKDKKINKQFKKLHNKIQNLNVRKFEKLSCKKRKKTANNFQKFSGKVGENNLNDKKRLWLNCQQSWWINIIGGMPAVNRHCIQQMFNWQLDLVDNCPQCYKRCQADIFKNKKDHRQPIHRHYSKKHNHDRKKSKHQKYKDASQDTFDNQFTFDKNHKEDEGHGNVNQQNTNENKPDQFSSTLPGLVFEEQTSSEDDSKKPNMTDTDDIEEYDECNPNLDVCDKKENNWYLHQMEHRKYERRHRGDSHDGKADWMFKRAEEREFTRTQPDDWYFRRWNEWNKHQPPPEPEKQYRGPEPENHYGAPGPENHYGVPDCEDWDTYYDVDDDRISCIDF